MWVKPAAAEKGSETFARMHTGPGLISNPLKRARA